MLDILQNIIGYMQNLVKPINVRIKSVLRNSKIMNGIILVEDIEEKEVIGKCFASLATRKRIGEIIVRKDIIYLEII